MHWATAANTYHSVYLQVIASVLEIISTSTTTTSLCIWITSDQQQHDKILRYYLFSYNIILQQTFITSGCVTSGNDLEEGQKVCMCYVLFWLPALTWKQSQTSLWHSASCFWVRLWWEPFTNCSDFAKSFLFPQHSEFLLNKSEGVSYQIFHTVNDDHVLSGIV